MSETSNGAGRTEAEEAATEAAQNAVDETTSWEYSAERETIERDLDTGLDQSGVEVEESEKQRLVDEIDDVKEDEGAGSPRVDASSTSPARDA